MEGDTFDQDELLNRRIEVIETKDHGSIFARIMGDPAEPLILYLHGNGAKSNTSAFWNMSSIEVARKYQAMRAPPNWRPKQPVCAHSTATPTIPRGSPRSRGDPLETSHQ